VDILQRHVFFDDRRFRGVMQLRDILLNLNSGFQNAKVRGHSRDIQLTRTVFAKALQGIEA
jgi:hypothetical protein